MGWSGQEDGMDVMKEIIQKEIQSISSLEERVIFKNLMEGVFLSLYDTNREMYEGLERRIKEELDYDKNRYYVKTGIVEREFSMPPTICCHQWMKVIWQKNCMI